MFYGEKLRLLRETFSYTQEELAKKLSVDLNLLLEIENNQKTPNFMLVRKLQECFYVSHSFFFKPSIISKNAKNKNITYKEEKSYSRENIHYEKTYLDMFYSHINYLEQIVYPDKGAIFHLCQKILQKYNMKKISKEEIKQIAEFARESFGVITNQRLMYFLEASGVYIVERSISKSVEAYSSWLFPAGYPVIVLNKNEESTIHRNYLLARELGHLLLHRFVDFSNLEISEFKKVEQEAKWFAYYFLIPSQEYREDFFELLHPTDPNDYLHLKIRYQVSIANLASQALDEGWLTKEEYQIFEREMIKYGYFETEPLEKEYVIPTPQKIYLMLVKVIELDQEYLFNWINRYSVHAKHIEMIFGIEDKLLQKQVDNLNGQTIYMNQKD